MARYTSNVTRLGRERAREFKGSIQTRFPDIMSGIEAALTHVLFLSLLYPASVTARVRATATASNPDL